MYKDDTATRNPVKDAIDILPENIRESISRRINEVINYEPVIGIMGKTGAGKSSLCNAIFKGEVCAVSDVEACTRETQEIRIQFGKRSVKLIDIPGVGESAERDKEYEQLYRDLLPQLDLVLWVVKGDDRAFSADEHFYKNVLIPAGGDSKTLFVLNQVDKIEPFREWDIKNSQPSPAQMQNIRDKETYLTQRFGFTDHPIISVAASEGYNVTHLVEAMVRALPKHAQSGVASQVKDEHKTEAVIEEATAGFGATVEQIIDAIIDQLPPGPRIVAKAVKKVVVGGIKKAWNWIFG
ncbi:ATP-binding cassette domain-containing protein [Salmonella enterica subsp. enterica serovar Carno]|uniref:HSR1-like GTP-binding protein n=1 Tax=Phytobacter diazotrophicus TaxID=395631 RepID=A0ABN6LMN9_9ENTR|nr:MULTISPECIES: GTPase [Phytobacter]EBC0775836.1 ATP-binding cassette domain-containing protein [Salmonella enterica]ECI4870449.1 ferrous iron transporter B [Salmonella enterica subsp. enterica]EDV9643092.1 ATP-binding cassette domain-containing protein [Salmonella enterica subsp. enterica serovar Carno]MDU7381498.1 GTPase [Enterobacteriaceae bacterium]ECI6490305.1 ATP-binding cassette domain-containing protein [Salmonella enterica subsp. enterica]